MSTAKRTRARQTEAGAAPSLPPSKKAKTSQQANSGLAFLTDENQRAARKLRADYTNGVKDLRADRVDESKAQVERQEADALEVVEISSSAEDESDYQSSEDEADDTKPTTNGVHDADDAVMADAGEAGEQSFGDMLQAAHPETIDVQSAFADREQGTQALVPMPQDRALAVPTATSLGTVLTQALRTNDRELLETCFQMTDIPSIRSTIQRLQSPLVASLLQRLAERLHKRPGRAGNLMVWVQWSLVSHGGYLASQPDVLKKLKTLSRVIKDRANGLQSLVTLKGKLDMLSAQIDLRKSIQEARDGRFDDTDNVDSHVIYVEGEEDNPSDDDNDLISNAVGSDLGDLSMVNGGDQDSSDVDEEEAGEAMFDDEAEETSDDEGEELSDDDQESDEVDDDDNDNDESSDDDNAPATVKPSKSQSRAPAAGRRR